MEAMVGEDVMVGEVVGDCVHEAVGDMLGFEARIARRDVLASTYCR